MYTMDRPDFNVFCGMDIFIGLKGLNGYYLTPSFSVPDNSLVLQVSYQFITTRQRPDQSATIGCTNFCRG